MVGLTFCATVPGPMVILDVMASGGSNILCDCATVTGPMVILDVMASGGSNILCDCPLYYGNTGCNGQWWV